MPWCRRELFDNARLHTNEPPWVSAWIRPARFLLRQAPQAPFLSAALLQSRSPNVSVTSLSGSFWFRYWFVSPCAQPALPSAACKPELLKPTLLLMFHLIFILFFFLGKPSRIKAVPCQDNDGHYVACHFAMTSPQPLRAFSFTSCPPSLQPLSPRLFFGRELCRMTRKS